MNLVNGENAIWPKCLWVLTVFVEKVTYEQLGLHRYAVNKHPDEFVLEPPPKKSSIHLCVALLNNAAHMRPVQIYQPKAKSYLTSRNVRQCVLHGFSLALHLLD